MEKFGNWKEIGERESVKAWSLIDLLYSYGYISIFDA